MHKFSKLLNKKSRLVIGILSGTSVNSVDLVLLKINNSNKKSSIKVLAFQSYPIKNNIKNEILRISSKKYGNVENICKMNFVIGRMFAEKINNFIKSLNLNADKIDLIGSHGQTVYHYPFDVKFEDYSSKSTLQIGDPSVIANLTNITTVGDFRNADVAVGGNGAPLVPHLDYVFFSDRHEDRILINIGGIANLTYLEKNTDKDDLIAFDSGPGNMLIDGLMREFFNQQYDKDGKIAESGNFNNLLFYQLLNYDNYFKMIPPKSTGREYYGNEFVKFIISKSKNISKKDVIRTVSEYTAYTIWHNISYFLRTDDNTKIYVSGGGADNKFLIKILKKYFPENVIEKVNVKGINSKNKEAVLFALLANETINYISTNIPNVTGAEKEVLLGKICLA